jgi:protein dithiol:quinone oxidoreductase
VPALDDALRRICPRAVFGAVAVLALIALATAFYLQHETGMAPCPYCVLQRYAYFGIVACAVLAGIDTARARWHGAGVGAIASVGLGLAVWQLTRGPSMTSCGVDRVGELVNGSPLARAWPGMFLAEGSCADRALVAGVPLPLASAALFLALGSAAAWAARARRSLAG